MCSRVNHKSSKKLLSLKQNTEKDIADALERSNEIVRTKGETLPENQHIYRVKVVKAFLRSGVPLNKISSFQELLEENALRLTDRQHMADLIPFILEQLV